jgi:hypothetical protein
MEGSSSFIYSFEKVFTESQLALNVGDNTMKRTQSISTWDLVLIYRTMGRYSESKLSVFVRNELFW